MELKQVWSLQILVILFGLLPSISEALTCYQCNVFIRGTPWPCNHDQGMRTKSDCLACLKTYTRTYLQNTFHDDLLTSFESRLCVKEPTYQKEAGCHARETDSGYMKRCYCYTDLCNASTRPHRNYATVALTAICAMTYRFLF